jgi:hypothetical protein
MELMQLKNYQLFSFKRGQKLFRKIPAWYGFNICDIRTGRLRRLRKTANVYPENEASKFKRNRGGVRPTTNHLWLAAAKRKAVIIESTQEVVEWAKDAKSGDFKIFEAKKSLLDNIYSLSTRSFKLFGFRLDVKRLKPYAKVIKL